MFIVIDISVLYCAAIVSGLIIHSSSPLKSILEILKIVLGVICTRIVNNRSEMFIFHFIKVWS